MIKILALRARTPRTKHCRSLRRQQFASPICVSRFSMAFLLQPHVLWNRSTLDRWRDCVFPSLLSQKMSYLVKSSPFSHTHIHEVHHLLTLTIRFQLVHLYQVHRLDDLIRKKNVDVTFIHTHITKKKKAYRAVQLRCDVQWDWVEQSTCFRVSCRSMA